MSIMAALASHLKNNAGVSAIVGTRVYRDVAPPNAALPNITVTRLATDHQRHQSAAAGLVRATVQVNAWDDNPEDAETLADAIRSAMDQMIRKDLGSAPNNVAVKVVALDDDSGSYLAPSSGGSVGTFSIAQTWSIWHAESVPVV
jgi:hypothetical protein